MGRRRLLWVVLWASVLLFALPALASAASYSWDQPADFAYTGAGHNPGGDVYGPSGATWSYDEGPACSGLCPGPPSQDPSGFTPLPNFAAGTWSDTSSRFIGPPTSTGLAMGATSDRVTALGWKNPLGHQANVSVTGAVGTGTGGCQWSLDQGGTVTAPAPAGGPITGSFTVPPDGRIYLTLYAPPGLLAAPCSAPVTLHITESDPTPVTLTSPADGSSTSSSQPTFAGTGTTAYGSSSAVTVQIYAGGSASGGPLQSLSTTRTADGSFSVAPSTPLSAGTYTAQATQSIPGDAGQSAPVTFQVIGSSSPVTLNQLPTAGPLTDSAPTLTGQSGGDATATAIAIYAGPAVAGSPVRVLTAPRNVTTGTFAAPVSPPLPDGQYTAIAGQHGSQPGVSNPVTFRIKAHAPVLTVLSPRRGGSAFGPRPTFLGGGGSTLGDAPTISLTLHRGSSSEGPALGTETAPVSAAGWILKWGRPLATGFYTLVAQQDDDAGHTSLQYVTFVVVPTPPVIGSLLSLRGSTAAVTITCTAPAGTCAGSVLALSTKQLRTRSGGPAGYVRMLFAYVRIGAGDTTTVRMRLPGYVAAALRRVHGLQAKVSVSMVGVGHTSATRSVAT